MIFEHVIDYGQYAKRCHEDAVTTTASGIDALVLPAITDLKEAWYGIEIDKTRYRIVLEGETEDAVYLKIVKKQPKEKE